MEILVKFLLIIFWVTCFCDQVPITKRQAVNITGLCHKTNEKQGNVVTCNFNQLINTDEYPTGKKSYSHQLRKRNIFKKLKKIFRRKSKKTKSQAVQINNVEPNKTRVMNTSNWVTPTFGSVPSEAFLAGHDFDGTKIYIGKGKIPNERSVVPGRLSEIHNSCVEITWRGWGRCLRRFEVLVGSEYKWEDRSLVNNSDAVIGGFEETESSPYFICSYYMNEANITNHLVIGKVVTDGTCFISYNGHEIFYTNLYGLLVKSGLYSNQSDTDSGQSELPSEDEENSGQLVYKL